MHAASAVYYVLYSIALCYDVYLLVALSTGNACGSVTKLVYSAGVLMMLAMLSLVPLATGALEKATLSLLLTLPKRVALRTEGGLLTDRGWREVLLTVELVVLLDAALPVLKARGAWAVGTVVASSWSAVRWALMSARRSLASQTQTCGVMVLVE